MPGAVRNFIGREGFIWFIGVVEDRQDPEQLGRVRVRAFGWHTDDKSQIPTEDLPWAHVMQSPNIPAAYAPKEGDFVCGFFMDGDSAQNPVVMGILPGKQKEKPDYEKGFSDPRTNFSSAPTSEAYPLQSRLDESSISRLARGKTHETVIETRERNRKTGIAGMGISWEEPKSTYAPQYPYNYVQETESGHALELDDTKGAERVHLAHKVGTYTEFDTNGNRVDKIVKDRYSVVMGKDYMYVQGDCNITVGGNCNLQVGGKFNVQASEINLTAGGAVNIRSGAGTKIQAMSTLTMGSMGITKISAGGMLQASATGPATFGGSTTTLTGMVTNPVLCPMGMGKILPGGGGGGGSIGGFSVPTSPAMASMAGAVNSVKSAVGGVVGGALQGLSGLQVGALSNLAKAVPFSSVGQFSGAMNTLRGAVTSGSLGSLSSFGTGSLGGIAGKLGGLSGIAGNISGKIGGLTGGLTASLGVSSAGGLVGSLSGRLTSGLASGLGASISGNVIKGISGSIGTGFSSITASLSSNALKAIGGTVSTSISSIGGNAVKSIGASIGISSIAPSVSSTVRGILGSSTNISPISNLPNYSTSRMQQSVADSKLLAQSNAVVSAASKILG